MIITYSERLTPGISGQSERVAGALVRLHALVRVHSVCFYHLEMALIDSQTSSMRSSCFLIKIIETDDLLVVNQLTTSQ
jgi:hypothetical protein